MRELSILWNKCCQVAKIVNFRAEFEILFSAFKVQVGHQCGCLHGLSRGVKNQVLKGHKN
jgi:hypothetical protein